MKHRGPRFDGPCLGWRSRDPGIWSIPSQTMFHAEHSCELAHRKEVKTTSDPVQPPAPAAQPGSSTGPGIDLGTRDRPGRLPDRATAGSSGPGPPHRNASPCPTAVRESGEDSGARLGTPGPRSDPTRIGPSIRPARRRQNPARTYATRATITRRGASPIKLRPGTRQVGTPPDPPATRPELRRRARLSPGRGPLRTRGPLPAPRAPAGSAPRRCSSSRRRSSREPRCGSPGDRGNSSDRAQSSAPSPAHA